MLEKDLLPDWVKDDEAMFKALNQRPPIAWPTVALFFLASLVFGVSTYLGLTQQWHYAFSWFFNAVAIFIAFTVLHDASHRALSTYPKVNALFGQLSTAFLTPTFIFTIFRYLHMQHHRFTNHSKEVDPDYWVSEGPKWLLPLKWCFLDLYYYFFYLSKVKDRPAKEKREVIFGLVALVIIMSVLISQGWFEEYLLFHFLPGRGAMFLLAMAFDYLPHHPHTEDGKEKPYQATNIRLGMERLLTPVLLYQNYHLVHHLYPLIPFYRYIRVWHAKEKTMLENQARIVSPVMGTQLSQQEYLDRSR